MVEEGVTVEIFGHRYVLKSEFPEKQVREVALLVDGRMREVAKGTKAVNTLHIAILTALNIAQDYLQERQKKRELLKRIEVSSERLNEFITSNMG